MAIQPLNKAHSTLYGQIYADAFNGAPWYDHWQVADAIIHVEELIHTPTVYGLEYVANGEVAGFILGSSMLFSYGRVFEINDLAIAPAYQHQGIGRVLLEQCLADLKKQGIVGVHLITQSEGALPAFYSKYGFTKENVVMLMGKSFK